MSTPFHPLIPEPPKRATMNKGLFLTQAVPWVLLFGLWTIISLAVMALLSIPLRLIGVLCRVVATRIELLLAAALAVLMRLRPEYGVKP